MCTKKPFVSKKEAIYATRAVAWRMRAYFCKPCNKWHITNQEKERGNMDRKYKAKLMEKQLISRD